VPFKTKSLSQRVQPVHRSSCYFLHVSFCGSKLQEFFFRISDSAQFSYLGNQKNEAAMRMRGSKVTDLKYRSVLENSAGLQERKAWIPRKVCESFTEVLWAFWGYRLTMELPFSPE
jgi:hypothetical protein